MLLVAYRPLHQTTGFVAIWPPRARARENFCARKHLRFDQKLEISLNANAPQLSCRPVARAESNSPAMQQEHGVRVKFVNEEVGEH